MSAVDKIKEKLKNYPQVVYDEAENFISVLPVTEKGFTVSLEIGYDDIKVFYNGWHENFENEEDALNCFAFGLSAQCRLKEYSRGGEPFRWTFEYKDEEDWIEESTTSLFNFSFWKETMINYLQNDLIN